MDIFTHELCRLDASSANNLIIVLNELLLELVLIGYGSEDFHDWAEQLKPVTDKVEPIFPAMNELLVCMWAAINAHQQQVSIIEEVVKTRIEFAD